MRHGEKQIQGEVKALIKELPENVKPFVQAILGKPDFLERLAKLSRVLRSTNQKGAAERVARYALSVAPDNAMVRRHAYWAVGKSVPRWHFNIVSDEQRNSIYREALERYVTEDTHVLEIGTGTGLLAMLAARAGARMVTTCEKEASIAKVAREIVQRNGSKIKSVLFQRNWNLLSLEKTLLQRQIFLSLRL